MSKAKNWIAGRLGINADNSRYGLLSDDLWEHEGFHCGEPLQVKIDGVWTDTTMEMTAAGEWYLVGTPYKGNDIEYVRARISK